MNHQEAIQVADMLKTDKVWGILGRDNTPGWISVLNATEEDLTSIREYIERLYENMSPSLPAGDVGGRMMLRYLNGRVPKNGDTAKSLHIRALCVCPRAVNLEWEDEDSKKRNYVILEKDIKLFLEFIREQTNNWARLLFEISGGRFVLDYTIQCSNQEMTSLTRRDEGDKRCYRLYPEDAKKLILPQENIMLYIFWLPKWKESPPSSGVGHFSKPRDDFRAPYITLYAEEKRLKDPKGFVYLDGGLPHEFWHYIRYLAAENGFKGFMPSDHDKPGWEKLKKEIELQGLPVPPTAHQEKYPNLITWRFIEALKQKYDTPQHNK